MHFHLWLSWYVGGVQLAQKGGIRLVDCFFDSSNIESGGTSRGEVVLLGVVGCD